jgi:ferredoxin
VKVAVDRDVCMLNAECTLAAPGVFRIGDDGELEVDPHPSPEQEAAVREAIDACPTFAIELVDES